MGGSAWKTWVFFKEKTPKKLFFCKESVKGVAQGSGDPRHLWAGVSVSQGKVCPNGSAQERQGTAGTQHRLGWCPGETGMSAALTESPAQGTGSISLHSPGHHSPAPPSSTAFASLAPRW